MVCCERLAFLLLLFCLALLAEVVVVAVVALVLFLLVNERKISSSKSLSTTHTDTIHLISGGVSEKIGNHFTSGFFGSSFYPTNDLSLDTLNLGKLWQLQNNTFHPTWGRMSLSSVVAHTLITQRNLRALCQLLSPSCN
uniref:(northern house mosquito) hypothetical protein n=1 Tax=Culex pipiens TaxID=7175 RepID=A0A8D7ZUF8_CULPI